MTVDNTIGVSEKNIYLRPIAESDVTDRYVSWLNDPLVNQYLETRFSVQTKQSVGRFVLDKINSSSEFLYAICLLKNDRHVGNIKIGPINYQHLRGDLSLFLGDKTCWKKGVASAAVKLMVDKAFIELQLNKITAGIYCNNLGSVRVFERNGFVQEGLLKQHFNSGGQWQDAYLMGLTSRRYQSRCAVQHSQSAIR